MFTGYRNTPLNANSESTIKPVCVGAYSCLQTSPGIANCRVSVLKTTSPDQRPRNGLMGRRSSRAPAVASARRPQAPQTLAGILPGDHRGRSGSFSRAPEPDKGSVVLRLQLRKVLPSLGSCITVSRRCWDFGVRLRTVRVCVWSAATMRAVPRATSLTGLCLRGMPAGLRSTLAPCDMT